MADPGGRGLRLHRAGRALRGYIHPLTIPSTAALGAASGALLALRDHRQRPRRHRDHRRSSC
ncbi:hypothetical protein ACRAWD_21365 [Caulobacter segnis]